MGISKISSKITGVHVNGLVYYDESLKSFVLRTLEELETDNIYSSELTIENQFERRYFSNTRGYNEFLKLKKDRFLAKYDLQNLIHELQEIVDTIESLEVAKELENKN